MPATEDALSAWIWQPIEQLRQQIQYQPDRPWSEHSASLLNDLGLSDPQQHPLTELLYRHLDTNYQQDDQAVQVFFASTAIDEWLRWAIPELAASWQDAGQTGPDGGQDTTAAGDDQYDPAAWQAFLSTNAILWDGTDATWQQFVDWFCYQAAGHGFGAPATGLVEHLRPMTAAERVSVLYHTYQVPLNVAVPAPTDVRDADRGTGATVGAGRPESATQPPAGRAPTPAEAHQAAEALVAERPEFAGIPADRRAELIAEVLSELNATV